MTTVSFHPSGTCPLRSLRRSSIRVRLLKPTRPDSSQTVSGKAGAVQGRLQWRVWPRLSNPGASPGYQTCRTPHLS